MNVALNYLEKALDAVFGANPLKCKQMYNIFLHQVAYQRNAMQTELGDGFTNAHNIMDGYNISGLFPFIHFMALYCKGVITKNEMIGTLYVMCDESKQPRNLVYHVFKQIDKDVTYDSLFAAMDPNIDIRVEIFNEFGILPSLVAEYKKAVDSDGNFYMNMFNSIKDFHAANEPTEGC